MAFVHWTITSTFLKLSALSTSSVVNVVLFECRMHLIASCISKQEVSLSLLSQLSQNYSTDSYWKYYSTVHFNKIPHHQSTETPPTGERDLFSFIFSIFLYWPDQAGFKQIQGSSNLGEHEELSVYLFFSVLLHTQRKFNIWIWATEKLYSSVALY